MQVLHGVVEGMRSQSHNIKLLGCLRAQCLDHFSSSSKCHH